jgi:excisionase family DNA binding protein
MSVKLVVDNDAPMCIAQRCVTKHAEALSVRDVAIRWNCSERHVRNLIAEGRLEAFRLGYKLIRVPLRAVVGFEQCQSTCESSHSEASTPPNLPKTEASSSLPWD